jgi:hypothetical protein
MNAFVNGIKSLFTGPDTSAQEAQIKQAKEDQSIALTRQRQTEQVAAGEASTQAGLASRQPRGRRLLQAATGDTGVQSTLG